jgi:hypothetical protein
MVVELILSYSVAKTAIVSVIMKRRINEREEKKKKLTGIFSGIRIEYNALPASQGIFACSSFEFL